MKGAKKMLFIMTMNESIKHGRADARLLDGCMERMASGDRSALEELYRAVSTDVYAFALSVLRDRHEAEDVMQDCFIKLYSSAGSYKSSGKPLAYIITVTKNLCIGRMRQKSYSEEFSFDSLENLFGTAEDLLTETKLLARSLFSKLDDGERQIIALHAVSGFKFREIASALDMPVSTVISKYNRAVKKLRADLKL